MDERTVFTIRLGQSWETFLRLLETSKIQTLDDVRCPAATLGDPHSLSPSLQGVMADKGITYRRSTPQAGILKAVGEARHRRVALLCSEGSLALPCHFFTMGRILWESGLSARHLQSEAGPVEVFTIGVTRHSAPKFFGALLKAGVKRLLDVRLNNWTQLAGFTKRDDLPFFLRELCGADYVHEPLLAPSRELLTTYKTRGGNWQQYERDFLALMAERRVEEQVPIGLFEVPTVLLCYEAEADFCHRRLVLDYLQSKWGCLTITHL